MLVFQKALDLEPADTALLNLLGYAAAYSGELQTGMGALRRYQAARPNEANPLDSMGDINLASGRFAEAEQQYRRVLAIVLDGLRPARPAPSPLPVGPLTDDELARTRYGSSARQLRRLRKAVLSGALRQQAERLGVTLPHGFVDVPQIQAIEASLGSAGD
jgi:tetratricopeptide (TPR) repeat protein